MLNYSDFALPIYWLAAGMAMGYHTMFMHLRLYSGMTPVHGQLRQGPVLKRQLGERQKRRGPRQHREGSARSTEQEG
jgi:hypothetical protein